MRAKTTRPVRQFGEMLAEARRARKWKQAELASRLGIGQQAVSGWERDISRPEDEAAVSAVAALFPEYELATWLTAAGFQKTADSTKSATIAKPVRPLLDTLPFGELSWEEFQRMSVMLVEGLYPGATVHEFGGQGDTQDGIDIEAWLPDSRRVTFQCKREKRFGPEKVEAAVRAHKAKSDLAVILLSRDATADARRVIARKRKWELWDARDIARKIRQLPPMNARRLVDAFFRPYRKDFLGIEEPGAFESIDEYFAPFLRRGLVFSHDWTLVGRDDVLKTAFQLLEGPASSVTLLLGAGGIGKTRLIRTIAAGYAAKHPNQTVLLLPATNQPTPRDFDLLVPDKTLVIIEDAHDRSDLGFVLSSAARASARVLITARPYARQLIRSDIGRSGYELNDAGIISLKGLDEDQAEVVAREILRARNGPIQAAGSIARLTHESPLALVVGSNLVALNRISPALLNNSGAFRDQLFASFKDAITGMIGTGEDRELLRDVLDLMALTQPADPERPEFAVMVDAIIKRPIDRVRRVIDLLFEGGILARRGRVFRIVPDLLGEYILEQSCVSKSTGSSSGYVERVLELADGESIANVLVNVAKLDWRLSERDDSASRIADLVWARVSSLCESSIDARRDRMLRAVAHAAYFQPTRALHFYDLATRRDEDRKHFATLLKHVAMNPEFVEEACARLWDLGRDDERALHQHPEHPVRILQELAAFAPEKPVEFNDRVIDFALRRLSEKSGPAAAYDLFDVIESALATEGHTSHARGFSIVFKRFRIRRAAVAAVRKKIIDFLLASIASHDIRTAVRSAGLIATALRGRVGAKEECDEGGTSWAEEFADTLGRLKVIVRGTTLDPLVLIRLHQSVNWHVVYGPETTRPIAQEVVNAFPKTIPFRLTLALVDGWGHLREGKREDYDASFNEWQTELRTIAKELIGSCDTPDAALDLLEERISAIHSVADLISPTTGVFGRIFAESTALAERLCQRVVNRSASPLKELFGEALFAYASASPVEALELARRALSSNDPLLARSVAAAYVRRMGAPAGVREDERGLISDLLRHSDAYVVTIALRAVAAISEHDPGRALRLLRSVDFSNSTGIAHEFFMMLVHSKTLPLASLTEPVIEGILKNLESCGEIEDYWLGKFLEHVSRRLPDRVVDLLIARLERDAKGKTGTYQPVPFSWIDSSPLRFRESSEFATVLRRVREWLHRAPRRGMLRGFWGPKLYAAVAAGYDDTVLNDLTEWIESGGAEELDTVALILSEAPRNFIFEHVGLVARFVERAWELGEKCERSVRSSLLSSATSGVKHGTPGEPFPEDIELRDRAQEQMSKLSRGSAAWKFFSDLKSIAEDHIRLERRFEEEELGY